MKISVDNYSSRWTLMVETHPDFAEGVPTPSGWERRDNTRSGIRERWVTMFTMALSCSPLVLVPEPGGWIHGLVKEEKINMDAFLRTASIGLSEKGEVVRSPDFTTSVMLSSEVREQLFSLCAAIKGKQRGVEERALKELFGQYTAKEFQTLDKPERICNMLSRAGYRPWTKRYLGGRHIIAFSGPDGLVKAQRALIAHLIGRGGVTAREVCQVTGASRIVEA